MLLLFFYIIHSFCGLSDSRARLLQVTKEKLELEYQILQKTRELSSRKDLSPSEMTRISTEISILNQKLSILTSTNQALLESMQGAKDDAKRSMRIN